MLSQQSLTLTDVHEPDRRLVMISDIEEQCRLLWGNIANWLYAIRQNPYDYGETEQPSAVERK